MFKISIKICQIPYKLQKSGNTENFVFTTEPQIFIFLLVRFYNKRGPNKIALFKYCENKLQLDKNQFRKHALYIIGLSVFNVNDLFLSILVQQCHDSKCINLISTTNFGWKAEHSNESKKALADRENPTTNRYQKNH